MKARVTHRRLQPMNAFNPTPTPTSASSSGSGTGFLVRPGTTAPRLPAALKWGFTAFMAVLVPVYWVHYGPANFLYFCDVALFLTLAAVWTERPIFASMAAVGVLVPQLLWCVDLALHLAGFDYAGMTNYMFDAAKPLYLRLLSLFHGWLPFMLIFIVARLGYDRRALKGWTIAAILLCLIGYFLLPAPGEVPAGGKDAVNVNYVFGISETKAQTWMSPHLYFVGWIATLILICYLPAHASLNSRFGIGKTKTNG